jgi:hypothetical protein
MRQIFADNLIPNDLQATLDLAFTAINFPDTFDVEEKRLLYLKHFADLITRSIESFTKELWDTDVGGFLETLVAEARFDAELSYSPSWDGECSLARYLFNAYSPLRKHLDSQIRQLAQSKPHEFSEGIVQLSFELLADHTRFSLQEKSLLLLLLFRVIFNRSYELLPEVFAPPTDPALLVKLRELSKLEAVHFLLPWGLLPKVESSVPIGELFRNDEHFGAAADILSLPLFDTNPIDALHSIHNCLAAIRVAAIVHQKGGEKATADDRTKVVAFDDLFALFFGTVLGAETTDIFFVGALIENFTPRESLSPVLEYAQANLQALVEYCRTISVAKVLEQRHPRVERLSTE